MTLEIDPEMRYCVKCKDEYMPEMTNCGVCGLPLVSGSEMRQQQQTSRQQAKNRKGALTPEDEIITIFKAALSDCKRIERQLQQENIGTLIFGEKSSGGCGKGCCGSGEMEVKVRREDAQAALAIVEEDFKRQTASHDGHSAVADYVVDPESSENVCPACGTPFSPSAGQPLTCPDCGLCFG